MNNSGSSRVHTYTFVVLISVFGYLSYNIIEPFLRSLAWSIVVGIVFYPLYAFLAGQIRWKSVASILTLLFVAFLFLGPFSYILVLLGTEIQNFVGHLEKGKWEKLTEIANHPYLKWVLGKIQSVFHIETTNLTSMIVQNVSRIGNELASQITSGLKNLVGVLFDFVLMFFILYFFFTDGPRYLKNVWNFFPFSEKHKQKLTSDIKDMVISTIYGGVIVSLSQGLMAGFAFYLLDVPSPVLLGAATSVMSFVPILGAMAVWLPVDVMLFFSGEYAKGVILLLAGVFGISMVDNILKPIIISGRTKMPILIVFISVLGGMKFFGLIGLVMGPLVLVLFVSFFEIFVSIETESNGQEPDGAYERKGNGWKRYGVRRRQRGCPRHS